MSRSSLHFSPPFPHINYNVKQHILSSLDNTVTLTSTPPGRFGHETLSNNRIQIVSEQFRNKITELFRYSVSTQSNQVWIHLRCREAG
jgi:hypothetical protein